MKNYLTQLTKPHSRMVRDMQYPFLLHDSYMKIDNTLWELEKELKSTDDHVLDINLQYMVIDDNIENYGDIFYPDFLITLITLCRTETFHKIKIAYIDRYLNSNNTISNESILLKIIDIINDSSLKRDIKNLLINEFKISFSTHVVKHYEKNKQHENICEEKSKELVNHMLSCGTLGDITKIADFIGVSVIEIPNQIGMSYSEPNETLSPEYIIASNSLTKSYMHMNKYGKKSIILLEDSSPEWKRYAIAYEVAALTLNGNVRLLLDNDLNKFVNKNNTTNNLPSCYTSYIEFDNVNKLTFDILIPRFYNRIIKLIIVNKAGGNRNQHSNSLSRLFSFLFNVPEEFVTSEVINYLYCRDD